MFLKIVCRDDIAASSVTTKEGTMLPACDVVVHHEAGSAPRATVVCLASALDIEADGEIQVVTIDDKRYRLVEMK